MLIALSLGGCEECLPQREALRGMRVIGVTLTPPAAAPGATVRARAVAVDIEGRDVDVLWFRCPRPLYALDRGAPTDSEALAALVDETFARCLAQGAFARGIETRVTVDAAGGGLDTIPRVRAARRWTDLVGAACAGGEVTPPTAESPWPRCNGGPAVVFAASIPGPDAAGELPTPRPLQLTLSMRQQGRAVQPWGPTDRPVVSRCQEELRCRNTLVDVEVDGSQADVMVVGSQPISASQRARIRVGWLATAVDNAPGPRGCRAELDELARSSSFLWRVPREPGDVRFWFWVADGEGGFSWTQRTVRVE